MKDDKTLDLIIEILDLLGSYTPASPSNPQLGLIRARIAQLKILRIKTKARFTFHLDNLASLTKQISDIKI